MKRQTKDNDGGEKEIIGETKVKRRKTDDERLAELKAKKAALEAQESRLLKKAKDAGTRKARHRAFVIGQGIQAAIDTRGLETVLTARIRDLLHETVVRPADRAAIADLLG